MSLEDVKAEYVRRLRKGEEIPLDLEFYLSSKCWKVPSASIIYLAEMIHFRWYFAGAQPETVDGEVISDPIAVISSQSAEQIVELVCRADSSFAYCLVENADRFSGSRDDLLKKLLERLKGPVNWVTGEYVTLSYVYAKLCSKYLDGAKMLAEAVRNILTAHPSEYWTVHPLVLSEPDTRWRAVSILLAEPDEEIITTIFDTVRSVDDKSSLPLEKAFEKCNTYSPRVVGELLDIARWTDFKVGVDELMLLTKHSDPTVAEKAAELVLRFYPDRGEQVIDAMIQQGERLDAALLLEHYNPEKACKIAEGLLTSGEPEYVRYSATRLLTRLRPEKALDLLRRFGDVAPPDAVFEALRNLDSKSAEAALRSIFCDEELAEDLRLRAALLLGLPGDKEAKYALRCFAADEEQAEWLYRVLKRNVGILRLDELKEIFQNSSSDYIRTDAACLLALKGDAAATDYLWRRIGNALPDLLDEKNPYAPRIRFFQGDPDMLTVLNVLWEVSPSSCFPFLDLVDLKEHFSAAKIAEYAHKAPYLSFFLVKAARYQLDEFRQALPQDYKFRHVVSTSGYNIIKTVIDEAPKDHPLVRQLLEEIATSKGTAIDCTWLWLDLKRRASLALGTK
jgi:HEAT repeat protein